MAVLNIYNLAGEQTGTVEVNDAVFGIEPNKVVLHEVLTAELAAARQGTIRAPHMVGGGVTFGPHPRSYEKKVNKKVRNLALRSALSAKVAAGNILVLDYDGIETPKTKVIVNLVNKVDAKQKQLFVVGDLIKDYNLYLSARNLENAVILQPNEIGVYWLLKQEKVILTKEALAVVEEVLG